VNRRNRLILIGVLVALAAVLAGYTLLGDHSEHSETAARGGSSGAILVLLMVVVLTSRKRRRQREEDGRNG
jgi:hypothetical protein